MDLTQAEAHWRSALRGFHTPTPFGVDTGRTEAAKAVLTGTPFGARQTRLSTQLTAQLRETARTAGVTINTMLQAAWALLLHRYSGQSDIIFGATRAGRQTGVADSESQVGLFINTLPIRVRVDASSQMIPWLQDLRAQQAGLRAFEQTPLSRRSHGARCRAASLCSRAWWSTIIARWMRNCAHWVVRGSSVISNTSGRRTFRSTLVAYGDDEMLVRLEYSRQRFSDAAIERMLGHLSRAARMASRAVKRHN